MQENTKKLTFGAMIVAIFGVLLLANRQTAGLLEEMFMYIFPIPMVAFSARYDWKNSLPVLFCMCFFSFLFGTFSTMFYAISGAVTGLVLGTRIYRKRDMTRTLVLVMLLSAVANLLSTYVLASVMGYDLAADLTEMETMMHSMMQTVIDQGTQNGVNVDAYTQVMQLLTPDYIRRIFLISMIIMGLVQGFLVYELSLLILRRLRYPVPRPTPISEFAPPAWSAIAAGALFFGYSYTLGRPLSNEVLQNLLQAGGMMGMMYLAAFGYIAAILFLRRHIRSKALGFLRIVVPLLLFMTMPQVLMLAGFFYITGSLRRYLTEAPQEQEESGKTGAAGGGQGARGTGTAGAGGQGARGTGTAGAGGADSNARRPGRRRSIAELARLTVDETEQETDVDIMKEV